MQGFWQGAALPRPEELITGRLKTVHDLDIRRVLRIVKEYSHKMKDLFC
jgi:hypothetical protein